MYEFRGIFHILAALAAINHASGNHMAVPTPKRPMVFGFGWPNITLVTASVESIPIEGIVQYELFYNKTCHFLPSGKCSSVVRDLSPVDGCRKVENQTSASVKVSSCTICNSTKVCDSMGITKDNDLCLYLKVTTSFGCSHVCMERNYYTDILVYPPPKTIQILATKKKQLTVLWEHPEGIDPSSGIQINYIVILQDHLGQCKHHIHKEYGEGSINTFNFTGLSPWSNYSVTICSALQMSLIPVNKTACTCGDYHHLPGGPVFNLTLPEEPSEPPLLQPCEALCVDTNFSAILKWKASENLILNGIPTKSVIRIWNSSSPDIARQDVIKLDIAVATFSVPLGSNYNGSLMTFHVNLMSHLTYVATVQFCSNGGCGPYAVATLSCDVCESLGLPDELSGKPSPSPSAKSYWPEIGVVVSCFVLVVAVVVTVVIKRKKRQRNRQSIQDTIGNLEPENNYEDPDFADMTSDDGPYSPLCSSESQVLLMDDQAAQRV